MRCLKKFILQESIWYKKNALFFLHACVINCSLFAQQLVLPGDHPDPSVTKIGNRYWASATTSN